MEGLLYYAPANFWATVLYACTLVCLFFYEWARDRRMREPEDVIHLLIDEAEITEELKKAA